MVVFSLESKECVDEDEPPSSDVEENSSSKYIDDYLNSWEDGLYQGLMLKDSTSLEKTLNYSRLDMGNLLAGLGQTGFYLFEEEEESVDPYSSAIYQMEEDDSEAREKAERERIMDYVGFFIYKMLDTDPSIEVDTVNQSNDDGDDYTRRAKDILYRAMNSSVGAEIALYRQQAA